MGQSRYTQQRIIVNLREHEAGSKTGKQTPKRLSN